MTIPIREARIDVYQGPDEQVDTSADPDFTIPGEDIISVDVSARIDEIMDDVSVELHNHDLQYTGHNRIKQSDRIQFAAPMEDGDIYGDGIYGSGMWGGTYTIFWTGRVTDVAHSRDGPNQAFLDIEARDYPADILSNRKITDSYVEQDVGAIIRDICRQKAPELDVDHIRDMGFVTDVKFSSADCWDAVLDLAARADTIVIPRGTMLRVEPISDLPYMFSLDDEDIYLPLETSADDTLKNAVRIDSGESRKLEAAQEEISRWGYSLVTKRDPLTHRLRARKAAVHSLELYVRPQDVEEELSVRLQSDEGGEPVAIDDPNSDIVAATLRQRDLPDEEGWVTFFFDDHILADRDPWLIVQGEEDGHEVARNEDNELAFRSYYPHPLNFEVLNEASVTEYGRREVRIERANLKTLSAVQDAARAELARTAWPSRTVKFEARSKRAHSLQPGDRIDIDRPDDDIEGEHIITEVDRTWDSDSVMLSSVLTAEWRKGVLAPQTPQ